MTYSIAFTDEASEMLSRLDKSIQIRLFKKIVQLEREDFSSRHLKQGLPFFVEEAGGYRIVFEMNEREKKKVVLFVGDHKQYEKWYS